MGEQGPGDPGCPPVRSAVLAIGGVPALAQLALHLVGLRTLFRCQHLIELRRSFRPNRDKLTEKLSLLIGQHLNLSVALIPLGGRAQRLPVLLQLLTNGWADCLASWKISRPCCF